ncbi:uncharacterized protein METZ01_LOCUS27406 [marine metagenome]|uniref:Uncharacterized protein n=1 Tax=marine metagenome TaxID=408172 RepID=A0A381Q5H0_9ZZZZ
MLSDLCVHVLVICDHGPLTTAVLKTVLLSAKLILGDESGISKNVYFINEIYSFLFNMSN